MEKPIILCVDDEKIVLDSLKKELITAFKDMLSVEVAESASEALILIDELIQEGYDIPIIISDWLMPEMKGDEFLIKVHSFLPSTRKIMLTGQATTQGVGNVVNKAKLYRYIAKPWESDDLDLTVTEAFKSYYKEKKITAQELLLRELNANLENKVIERTIELENSKNEIKEILDKTLNGSINALIKILMKSQPEIFGKALSMRTLAKKIIKCLGVENSWEIEIACLFSQIGCIDLPETMLAKYLKGGNFNQNEASVFNLHPKKTFDILSSIPKFEQIATGILNHLKDVQELAIDSSYSISAILRLCSDWDDLVNSGKTELESYQIIKKNKILYDYEILKILNEVFPDIESKSNSKDEKDIFCLNIKELKIGDVIAKKVIDSDGNLLFSVNEIITQQNLLYLVQILKRNEHKSPVYIYERNNI